MTGALFYLDRIQTRPTVSAGDTEKRRLQDRGIIAQFCKHKSGATKTHRVRIADSSSWLFGITSRRDLRTFGEKEPVRRSLQRPHYVDQSSGRPGYILLPSLTGGRAPGLEQKHDHGTYDERWISSRFRICRPLGNARSYWNPLTSRNAGRSRYLPLSRTRVISTLQTLSCCEE